METPANPYVGPRSFQTGDVLHGRDLELGQLYSLLIAERIVLLHSPSGAGKTSLVQAGLVPRLREDFNVLPVARVNLEPQADGNRYLLSTLISIEEGLPNGQRHPVEELAKLSLDEYLNTRPRDEDGPLTDVLLFDQFEELLTTSPTDRDGKLAFFAQLGVALKNRKRWALFAAREDFLGAFLPYVLPIPNRFNVKFRLDLLGVDAALEAIQKPAEALQVKFSSEAASKLVNDLRTVRVQRPDGMIEKQLGQYVEPVQLQVVCLNLWENRNPDSPTIELDDLSIVGDVDHSLASYYADSVARSATVIQQASDQTTGRRAVNAERTIREWFENQLITTEGFRGQVLMGYELSQGLENRAIRVLENSHIIRGEKRAGATWFELAHDRLIEPIRKNNAQWFNANLSVFEKQAELWYNQQRAEGLLLRGEALKTAEKEADSRHLTRNELEYLKACRTQRAQAQRRFLVGLGFISIVLIMLIGATGSSWLYAQNRSEAAATQAALANVALDKSKAAAAAEATAQISLQFARVAADESQKSAKIAEEQAGKALAGSLAAQASSTMNNNHALALLLGLEAYKREDNLLTRTTLLELMGYSPYKRLFGQRGPVIALAISPGGKLLVTSGCLEFSSNQCKQGEIILWDAASHEQIITLPGKYGLVNSLAFHPQANPADPLLLASGGCVGVSGPDKGCSDAKGQILLWDVTDPAAPVRLPENKLGHVAQVKSLAFSPDGTTLASGSNDLTIMLWTVSPTKGLLKKGDPLKGHSSFVNSVVFSTDGRYLISAGDDTSIRIWNLESPDGPQQSDSPVSEHKGAINNLTFSPDGKLFASAGNDRSVVLWEWAEPKLINPRVLTGHTGYVKSLAFSPDGTRLASASFDKSILLWDTKTGEQIGQPLAVHTNAVNAVSFGTPSNAQTPLLFSGSSDHTIIIWDLSTRKPVIAPERGAYTSVEAFREVDSTNGKLRAKVDGQNIILTDLTGSSLGRSFNLRDQHSGQVNALAFSPPGPDGKIYLASGGDDQTVVIWDVTDPAATSVFLRLTGFENPISALKFPEYLQLLALDDSGQITRANLNPKSWLQLACAAVQRSLTPIEWDQYLTKQPYKPACQ